MDILNEYAFSETIIQEEKINLLKNFIEADEGFEIPDIDLLQPYIQQMLIIACFKNEIELIDYIFNKYPIIDVSYSNNIILNNCKNFDIFLKIIQHLSFKYNNENINLMFNISTDELNNLKEINIDIYNKLNNQYIQSLNNEFQNKV